jgi:hypothetical protein
MKDGAVELDGTAITDPTFEIDLGIPRKYLLRVGKKQLFYFVVQ